ncbi:E3 ubiquitin-protein ligase MYLIP [Schistocerca nitens]|uniref:E3 ubiquitin-protein ligase MYLIP n=1 Tax=Schistocerca cancellata TaxID=274614 RepID=UPI002117CC11|nr:E3 ubiquitin-protein ligase MYLIP [Schistocerca cancellata]XP_049789506.1 E3 ubiquitin-protein ligase MYLIP [Schistocerca nitens]
MTAHNQSKMWCLVSQPNAVILEVEVDPKARGQECLEKVCQYLGIGNEADYFGLKYHCSKGEELWLNLRNPIERQVGGVPPYRFALRVKFWVPPHLLLQDTTRHQFYLHSRLDLLEGRLKVPDSLVAAKLAAWMAQAESGDYDPQSCPQSVYAQYCQLGGVNTSRPQDFIQMIAAQHRELKGNKQSAAEYWLLKEVSYLEDFGEEVFQTKTSNGGRCSLGVGPHGLSVYHPDSTKQSIPYTAIQSAASQRRSFHLLYLDLDSNEATLDLKLETSQAASGLYRAITEKHAFYSCETVRSAVTAQFIRDLKGTIVSIFNEDTSLGKKYVFDIRRTCREVYDNARRALYQSASSTFPPPEESPEQQIHNTPEQCDNCVDEKCKSSQRKFARLLEAMSCRICMDRGIDTAFFPCAHVIACSECAARCDRCPLCRAEIDQAKRIYLPVELQQLPTC